MKGNICSFSNRTAIVTGAAGNIGCSLCRMLSEHGVRIVACDVDAASVELRMKPLVDAGADIKAYGMEATSRESVFAAAKAGLIMFTKTLAMENAKKGITVNCVSPGMVARGEVFPEPGTWIGRKGSADEMARAMVFLAADESGFITGADIPVDGGRILGPHNCDM